MFGSDGATATQPRETVDSWSKRWVKLKPLLMVFSRPPEAVATKKVLGSDSTTAKSTIRPPMPAGPMERQVRDCWYLESRTKGGVAGEVVGAGAVVGPFRRSSRALVRAWT